MANSPINDYNPRWVILLDFDTPRRVSTEDKILDSGLTWNTGDTIGENGGDSISWNF